MSRGTLLVIGGEPGWIADFSQSLARLDLRALAGHDASPAAWSAADAPDYLLVRRNDAAAGDDRPIGGAPWMLVPASAANANGDGAVAGAVMLGSAETSPQELAARFASWLERERLAGRQREIVTDLTAAQRELEREREALRHELALANRELEEANRELRQRVGELSRVNLELERMREINANVIEALQESLVACDGEGCITHWSHDATELLGWERAEVMGRPFRTFLHSAEGDGALLYELMRRNEGRRVLTLKLLARGGEHRVVELRVSPLGSDRPGDRGMVVLLTDAVRKQREEEQIRRRDRLASLGELSAGVAHEIRNPLAGITTTAELLRGRLPGKSAETEFVDVILEEVGRLDSIIADLLTFARPRRPQPVRGDLHRTLDRMLLLLRRQVGKRAIEVVRHYDRTLPPVELDTDQILQLFLNLGLNSVEAMEHGGILTITTRAVEGPRAGDPDRTALPWMRVLLEDTGCGVAAEVRDKVFNPFFTTKGRGSGLGLAICQRIVEDHRGVIFLESSIGQGTTVTVDFPLSLAATRVDPQTELFGGAIEAGGVGRGGAH